MKLEQNFIPEAVSDDELDDDDDFNNSSSSASSFLFLRIRSLKFIRVEVYVESQVYES